MQARFAFAFLQIMSAAVLFALLGWAMDETPLFEGWERLALAVVGTAFVAGVIAFSRRESRREKAGLRRANVELEQSVLARSEELAREVRRRAQAEEALRAAEARFRDVTETMSEWVWETGPDLRISYVSRQFTEMVGESVEGVIGRTAAEVFRDPLENAARSFSSAYLQARRPFQDLAVRLKIGENDYHVALTGRPVFDSAGRFQGFRGTGVNMTEKVIGRRTAERLHRRHDLVLDVIDMGVFGIDRSGRVTFANGAALESLGWSLDELLDRPVHQTLCAPESGDGGADCALYEFMKRPDRRQVIGQFFQRKDGSRIPVDYVAQPISEDGSVTGLIVAFRATAERRRVEEELRRAKEQAEEATRAKSDFLAAMSHEFRTPLNAMMGFSDVILGELLGPLGNDRYREYIADIRRSAEHLNDMIADIVDLSKVESGRLELIEQSVDIAPLIEEALVMVRQEASRGGCSLINNVPGNLPPVRADARRLKQVLINLLSNAVKFTPPGGQVRISAEIAAEGSLRIVVSDTGVGIAPEDLPRVTEAFVQGNIAVSRKYDGAGLGLPLAKQLVERHGGRLLIESVVHEGTTVTVMLPPNRMITQEMQAVPASPS